MLEEKVVFNNVVLSFGSYLVLMFIAGFSVAIISILLQVVFSLFKIFAGAPGVTASVFFKPFISIITDPIDAVIAGVVIYPIYKIVVKKYFHLGIKLLVYRDPGSS